jgi:hypothetical protein
MPFKDHGAAEALVRCTVLKLVRQSDALDEYPVADLINAWPTSGARLIVVLQMAASSWLKQVDQSISDFPAADTAALMAIKERLNLTRDAMSELLSLARRLSQHSDARPGTKPRPAAIPWLKSPAAEQLNSGLGRPH